MQPVEYFQRQCYVSADQDDPGIKMVIDAVGDDNIVTATDFSHPEGRRFGEAAEMLMELPGVSMESKRKIMWDNALRLYPVEPAE
jgi:predicted TIM-barrel fold metal-dependent hydrolase